MDVPLRNGRVDFIRLPFCWQFCISRENCLEGHTIKFSDGLINILFNVMLFEQNVCMCWKLCEPSSSENTLTFLISVSLPERQIVQVGLTPTPFLKKKKKNCQPFTFFTRELVLNKCVSPWQERDQLSVLGPQRRSVQPQLRRESEDVLQPPGQRRHHRLQEGSRASYERVAPCCSCTVNYTFQPGQPASQQCIHCSCIFFNFNANI